MPESERIIDEYTLAAFLAGTLPDSQRQEVIEFLAAHQDAREVLQMAAEALDAARSGAYSEPYVRTVDTPAVRAGTREPARRAQLRSAGRYAAATIFVFVVGMTLRLAFGPPADVLRSPLPRSGSNLRVEVSDPGPSIEWPPVENAYRYRLVVWDQEAARVAGQYETTDTELGPRHDVVKKLRTDLRKGTSYTLRVDAIDAQNRLLQSSDTVELVI